MFEKLFDRAVGNTRSIGTSGSADFHESSAQVGDTLHAEFHWNDAQWNFAGEFYCDMSIKDPNGDDFEYYVEEDDSSGTNFLSAVTNMAGVWTAQINIWDGSNWLTYTDTVLVSTADGGEGEADIVAVDYPSTFTPGAVLHIYVEILNVGDIADYLFVKLTNVDDDDVLYDETSNTLITLNEKWIQDMMIVLSQTTDFHGLIESGHEE